MASIPCKRFLRSLESASARRALLPALTLALVAGASFIYRPAAPPAPDAQAGPGPAMDHAAVAERLSMLAGCFDVRYQFVEDGRGDFLLEGALEAMDVVPMGEGFVARNALIMEGQDPFLHWTQEWQPLEDGRWQLTVRSGDGSLRYQSRGLWRFNQWEGDPAPAAKPTRDQGRKDYDHLVRRNTLQFTHDRWVHSEINTKRRADETEVASELGWITYTAREDQSPCEGAFSSLR